jgi:hypothetical protein
MTMEELSNMELLALYVASVLNHDDFGYILELRTEIIDRMGGEGVF